MHCSSLSRAAALAVAAAAFASPVSAQRISICVLDQGRLQNVTATYDPATGDTTAADGRAFSQAYAMTAQYAAGHSWYIDNEMVEIGQREFAKYGLPRVLGVGEIEPYGSFHGVPVFVEAGAASNAEVIYIPVRTGCEFQPYQVLAGDEGYESEYAEDFDDDAIQPQILPIDPGETLVGALDYDDAMLEDDSFYDVYSFEGSAGERYLITLRSEDFDAYLSFGPFYIDMVEEIASDDDSGGGLDAQLEVVLQDDGEYGIVVNSLSAEEVGAYSITLERL